MSIRKREDFFREGLISIDQYINYPRKNILESAIGMGSDFDKQIFNCRLQIRDRILLSTDGFHNIFTKSELRDLSIRNQSLSNLNKELQTEFSRRKLTDNATFIILEIQ